MQQFNKVPHKGFIPIKSGFTLIEILVAIAIIGVLAVASITMINPLEQIKKSRDAQRKQDLRQLQVALEAYNSDNNLYPAANGQQIESAPWGGAWLPYIAKVPKDPVSPTQDYMYESAADRRSYRLHAKLENCKDPQIIGACEYLNYQVTSSNLAIAPLPTPIPTSTPTPTQITIPLNNRYNFISLPVTPPNTSVATIIANIENKVEIISYYDGNLQSWLSYVPGPAADSLSTLEPGKGYHFKMQIGQTADLQITGIPYEFQPISFGANKWYMIGAPYTDVKLSNVIGTCTLANIILSTIDGVSGASVSITVDSNTLLSSGKGYFIKSSAACTLSL